MKTVGIMQPYLFPYLGYFQLIKLVDVHVVYDDVHFIKRGWINRNNILLNGERKLLTIRLSAASQNKLINEIEIADDFSRFLQTLEMAYARAPYRSEVLALIERIVAHDDRNLARFAAHSLRCTAEHLGLDTVFTVSSDLQKENALRGQAKILAICRELSADRYVNPIGGRELYDEEDFARAGVELRFLEPAPRPYVQFTNDFVPNLSIIDVLMFNEPARVAEMLDEYELR